MKVLVTGGTGYIGSHTCVSLIENGHEPIILDNLYNSSEKVLERIKKITGVMPKFYNTDMMDKEGVREVFAKENVDAVIHFAGLKAVGESVEKPLLYYKTNIGGTFNIIEAMLDYGVKTIIFSSSATVYGSPEFVPITEECPKGEITNPYGKTKSMIEDILSDTAKANPGFNVVLLRYFNPIGAHKSGLMGEDPKGIPNNLLPYVAQVAIGKREYLRVWGNDYDTPDGTGVRDYIHVLDLADGHTKALEALSDKEGVRIYNLGTGVGYSVLDVVKAFSKVVGFEIPYKICDRRAGDIAECYADSSKAYKEIGFKTQNNLEDMCQDSWRWQKNNPNGYNE